MSRLPENRLTDAERRESAFDWLQRLPDETEPGRDLQAWLQWYGSSEDNRLAFDEAQSFYLRLRNVTDRHRLMLRAGSIPARTASATRRTVLFAVAACAAVALAIGVWWVVAPASRTHTYSAPTDQYRTVRLPDGSAMTLSARATASVSYAADSRVLEVLQGAAYFEVRRDARRPFIVRAGEISVTAVGTAFSVARDALGLSVTVTEGGVDVVRAVTQTDESASSAPSAASVSALPGRVRVRAGERTRLSFDDLNAAAHDLPGDVGHPWAGPSMQFFNAPLGEVIKAVNVYARAPIRIEDPRVTTLNYSGTVFRQRIDEWIAALPKIYPVRNVELDDGTSTVVLTSAEASRL